MDPKYRDFIHRKTKDANEEVAKTFKDRESKMKEMDCVGARQTATWTKHLFEVATVMNVGWLTPLVNFAALILGALFYGQEEGQIRSAQERRRTIELFSYDVGLFDFTVDESLSSFVQARALIKVGARLKIDQAEVIRVIRKKYYPNVDQEARVIEFVRAAYARRAPG